MLNFRIGIHTRFRLQQAWQWGSFGLVLPVLTLFLVKSGFSLFEVGLFTAIFSVSSMCLDVPFGALADRWGRLKTYQCSLFLYGIGCLMMVVCEQRLLLLLAAGCFGVGRALNSGTVDAWYVELLRQRGLADRIAYHLGYAECSVALGLAVCSLLGGALPDLAGAWLFDNPLKTGIFVAGVLFLMLLVATPVLFAEGEPPRQQALRQPWVQGVKEACRVSFANPSIRQLLALTLLQGGVIATIESYWPIVLKRMLPADERTWQFGVFVTLLFMVKGLGGLLSYRTIAWFEKDLRYAAAVPMILAAIGLAAVAFATRAWSFALLLALTIFFIGIAGATINTVLHRYTADQMRSRVLSLSSQMLQIGSLLASVVLSWLIDRYGIQPIWEYFGCTVGIVTVCGLLATRARALDGEPAS